MYANQSAVQTVASHDAEVDGVVVDRFVRDLFMALPETERALAKQRARITLEFFDDPEGLVSIVDSRFLQGIVMVRALVDNGVDLRKRFDYFRAYEYYGLSSQGRSYFDALHAALETDYLADPVVRGVLSTSSDFVDSSFPTVVSRYVH